MFSKTPEEETRVLVREVLVENPQIVASVKAGRPGQGFLVGRVLMKLGSRDVNPQTLIELIVDELQRA